MLSIQVDVLMIQFSFMVPEVKLFGFFNVGQPLLLTVSNIIYKNDRINCYFSVFPQILGTTLTYLLILYQYSSEGAV